MSSSVAHYRSPHNVPQTPPPHEKDLVLDQWLHPTTLKRRSSLDELDGRGGHHSFFGIDEDTALAHEDTARANEEWDDVGSAQPRREGSALDARMCTPCDASHILQPTSKFPPLPFFEGPNNDASMRRKSSLDDVQIARHKQNFGIDEDTVLKGCTDLAGKFELERPRQTQPRPMPTKPPASGHDLDELWSTGHPTPMHPRPAPVASIGPRYAVPTHTASTEPHGQGFVRRVSENVRRVSERLDSRSLQLEGHEATTPVLSRVALRATLSNDRLSSMVRIPSVGSTTSLCASISREDEGRNGSFDAPPTPQMAPTPTPKLSPPAIASPTPSLKQLDRFLTAMEQTQRSQSKHGFCYQEMIALQRETSHSRGRLLQWVCGSLASGVNKGGAVPEKANDDRTTFVQTVSDHAHHYVGVEQKRTLPHPVSYEGHPVRETKRARVDPPAVPSMTTINTATLDGEGRLQAELRRIAREQIVEMERRMRYNGQAA